MNTYQFIIALVPLIGTFIAQMVVLSRQASNHAEQKSMNNDVKASVNGVVTQLVTAAKEQGASDEREHPTPPF